MKIITPSLREAIRLFGINTGNRLDVWMLAGPHNRKARQVILSTLLGVTVPQSKSGVNALEAELRRQCGTDGTCGCDRRNNLMIFCRGVLNTPTGVPSCPSTSEN